MHLIRSVRVVFLVALHIMVMSACTALAADEEGCIICHKYPGLGRIDQQTGRLRLFYVNDMTYKNSVHGKILCRNCHLKLDVIPHADFAKVDCSTKCHVKEPSTDRDFSHGTIYNDLNLSVHGTGTSERPKKHSEDMPVCTDCHLNTVLQPVTGILDQEAGVSADALRRCIGCHTDKDWSNRFYQHFTHRLHRSKTALETVKLCLICHQNATKMARHGLITTDNYRDTYHWKGVLYGDKNAPDCLSCHAPVGYTIHSMKDMDDKASPVHAANLQQTCANQEGMQICHPNAVAKFASGKIHKTGVGLEETVNALVKGEPISAEIDELRKNRTFTNLMAGDEETDLSALSEQERLHWKVLMLVKYVYTLLITVVIGGMLVHQLFDFWRTVNGRNGNTAKEAE
jgi:hypothetical protein